MFFDEDAIDHGVARWGWGTLRSLRRDMEHIRESCVTCPPWTSLLSTTVLHNSWESVRSSG